MAATITGTQVAQGVFLDFGAIRRALEPGIKAGIKECVVAEQKAVYTHLSVPVTRNAAGDVMERSEPGDAPEMEEDILRQNIEWHVVTEEGETVGYLTAIRPPQNTDGEMDDPDAAFILENGGISNWGVYVQPRPFMRPASDRMENYAEEVIAQHLKVTLK
jgi:hypothetical protein